MRIRRGLLKRVWTKDRFNRLLHGLVSTALYLKIL